jgi:zinc transport system substrate-binding protein
MRAKGIGITGWSPMALRRARIERPGGGGPRAALALARVRALALGLALAFSPTFDLGAGILAGGSAALAETRIRIREHRVVASVLPLHSLVSGVMAGLGVPILLVRVGSSPHDTSLSPSDARALTLAPVVIWAGPTLESFLVKALEVLARDARVVTLTEEASLRRLPLPGSAPGGAQGPGDGEGPGAVDPHLWLDPVNAQAMVAIVAAALAETDPDNAEVYRANATRLAERLDALDAELRERLAPVRQVPYLVFHDAYAYFEARYGLNQVGTFAVNPEIRPGARHLWALRRRIRDEGVACVFIEPQFSPALVEAVTRGTAVRVATLDPLGAGLARGPEAYFRMMRALADDLVACLAGAD